MKRIRLWWKDASLKVRLVWGGILALTVILFTGLLLYLYIMLTLPNVEILIKQNPKTTAMIELRKAQAGAAGKKWRKRQYWVRFKDIPDLLKKSIRITEDASFYRHKGIDTEEMLNAFRKNWRKGRVVRGGSTITQQLAKNLYLSTDSSVKNENAQYGKPRQQPYFSSYCVA